LAVSKVGLRLVMRWEGTVNVQNKRARKCTEGEKGKANDRVKKGNVRVPSEDLQGKSKGDQNLGGKGREKHMWGKKKMKAGHTQSEDWGWTGKRVGGEPSTNKVRIPGVQKGKIIEGNREE